jgi:hypothetical protein
MPAIEHFIITAKRQLIDYQGIVKTAFFWLHSCRMPK